MAIKLASQILDFHDDTGCVIARALPPELHQLKVAGQDELDALPDSSFGLVFKSASGLQRRFPVHDEDSRKLSEAYVMAGLKAGSLHPEVGRLVLAKIAAARAGDALDEVAYVDPEKVAAAPAAFEDRFYGLTLGGASHYPLHDETLVSRAIERFPFTTDGMAPEHKFAYARNIEKRAGQLGVEIPNNSPINRYTGTELNPNALKLAIDQRKEAAAGRSGVHGQALDELLAAAGVVEDRGSMESDASFDLRQKLAKVATKVDVAQVVAMLSQFDKFAGITEYDYNRGMLDPYAACYKRAAAGAPSTASDGTDLSKIGPEKLQALFDQYFVDEFQQNPVATYEALPDPMKKILQGLVDGKTETASALPQGTTAAASGDPMAALDPRYSNGQNAGLMS